MIADVRISEKSFGHKVLMTKVAFSVDDHEKVGIVGRNGIGKSTLFGILAGTDKDYSGEVIYHRGTVVVTTAQEHLGLMGATVLQYVLAGIPLYPELSHIIETYPATMGDDMGMITKYTKALENFSGKGFYQIEEQIERELDNFQLAGAAHQKMADLSGGQKRLVEVVKVMHADAHLALMDEPTNHMDYVAKKQFIDWMKSASEAMLIITHDRDVLGVVDRIIELKDGGSVNYKGNYDAYLKQNAMSTSTGMSNFEMVKKRIVNLKQDVINYQRFKEKSRNPGTIQRFKRLETRARAELAELQAVEKPTFWIDKESVENLNYKTAGSYQKFKSRTIKMNLKSGEVSRSSRKLVSASKLSLGYGEPLFDGVNIDLREGEALELRGRNGAGKTTLIKALLGLSPDIKYFAGELELTPQVRVGIYEQEVTPDLFDLSLHDAVEKTYLDKDITINETKIRQLMNDYLFTSSDGETPVARLSGGQKARLQIIAMLANNPQLLILDEPTNHLDLPSIEELETALKKYTGAILYVSHDNYFRNSLPASVVQIGQS